MHGTGNGEGCYCNDIKRKLTGAAFSFTLDWGCWKEHGQSTQPQDFGVCSNFQERSSNYFWCKCIVLNTNAALRCQLCSGLMRFRQTSRWSEGLSTTTCFTDNHIAFKAVNAPIKHRRIDAKSRHLDLSLRSYSCSSETYRRVFLIALHLNLFEI